MLLFNLNFTNPSQTEKQIKLLQSPNCFSFLLQASQSHWEKWLLNSPPVFITRSLHLFHPSSNYLILINFLLAPTFLTGICSCTCLSARCKLLSNTVLCKEISLLIKEYNSNSPSYYQMSSRSACWILNPKEAPYLSNPTKSRALY